MNATQKLFEKLQDVNVFTLKNNINPQSKHILLTHTLLMDELVQHTSFLIVDTALRTRLFCVQHDIVAQPCCRTCGVPMWFNVQKKRFNNYCPNTVGVSCATSDSSLNDQRLSTVQQNYGAEGFGSSAIIDKRKATMTSRYGAGTPMEVDSIREKTRNTLEQRYGVSNISMIPGIKEKVKNSNMLKYNATTFAGGMVPIEVVDLLSDKEWVESRLTDFTIQEIADELRTTSYTVRKYVHLHNLENIPQSRNASAAHRAIMKELDNAGVEYLVNYRKLICPKEVDIYIPTLNVAIEFSGVYFHSELSGKNKKYHLDKTTGCSSAGVRLIQVWSNEWAEQKQIVISRILHSIGVNTEVLYARACTIQPVTPQQERLFLETCHIQGYCSSSIKVGLWYKSQLVALMTFRKSRFDGEIEWELLRFCSLPGLRIIGGASKLFKYFVRTSNPSSVVSYCDKRWGTGALYTAIGFDYARTSSPNYFYFKTNSDTNVLWSRQVFQKHKLQQKLKVFDATLTEWQNMQANGYDRIWDCGNDVFIWKPTT